MDIGSHLATSSHSDLKCSQQQPAGCSLVCSGSAIDAPGTPPAVAPAHALCVSPRGSPAAQAAAAVGLGASTDGTCGRLPTLVPVHGSAKPRVLLGCGGGVFGSAWPTLPLCTGALASPGVQAGGPVPISVSLSAAAALATGMTMTRFSAPAAALPVPHGLGDNAPWSPPSATIVPSSLAAAVAIASGAPLAAPLEPLCLRDSLPWGPPPTTIVPSSLAAAVAIASGAPLAAPAEVLSAGCWKGLGSGAPSLVLAPPALALAGVPSVWQLLSASLAAPGGRLGTGQGAGGFPAEDSYLLCRLGGAGPGETDVVASSAMHAATGSGLGGLEAAVAQGGTTVAYVCQATQLPPQGSSAPPLLPVKVFSAPASAGFVSPFARAAVAAAAASLAPSSSGPAAATRAAVPGAGSELEASPLAATASAALADAGAADPGGRMGLKHDSSPMLPPASSCMLVPSGSSAFSAAAPARMSCPNRSPDQPCPGAAHPPAHVPHSAGKMQGGPAGARICFSGRARRRHSAAREAAVTTPNQGDGAGAEHGPCLSRSPGGGVRGQDGATVNPNPNKDPGADRLWEDSCVVHRPAKLRRLLPAATQLLLLPAGSPQGPGGSPQGLPV